LAILEADRGLAMLAIRPQIIGRAIGSKTPVKSPANPGRRTATNPFGRTGSVFIGSNPQGPFTRSFSGLICYALK
jgi:hypothetical protein